MVAEDITISVWASTVGPTVTSATTVLVSDTNPRTTRIPLPSKASNAAVPTYAIQLTGDRVQ